jgi:ABC-type nickel/cobalt efflux system permease component RcnA/ABC-type uncharacterized transport system substrate-binding protein
MKKTLCILILAVCLCPALRTGPAAAHPHVFVDTSLTFVFDDTGLAAIRQNWLFDEIFSRAILSDIGLTPEALSTPEGQEAVREGAFAYLKNYGWFTFVESGGNRIPVTETRDFRASVRDGRLVYDFTVPLFLPYSEFKDFRMGVFDPEYYSDIVLVDGGIAFEMNGMAQVSHTIRPGKDHTYWQFIVPNMIHLAASDVPGETPQPAADMREVDSPGPVERLMAFVRSVQKELTQRLNTFGMELADNPFGPALWLFLGLSFIYGVIHAVGPGHGKAVVCSYFMANPGSLAAGAIMGNAITFVHMGSAAVAVGAAYMLFSSGMGGFAEASRAIQPASYGLLALMGLFLVFKSVRDILKGGLLSPGCDCTRANEPDDLRSILTVSFVTGLIPCPGAAVILAFAIGLNIFWTGVLALVCMALGMGLTTTIFAWFAVTARNVTLQLSGSNKAVFNRIYAGLSICGASAIALFGGALFLGSISG